MYSVQWSYMGKIQSIQNVLKVKVLVVTCKKLIPLAVRGNRNYSAFSGNSVIKTY